MILREEFLFVTLIHISITGADSPSSGTFYPLEFLRCNCKWWVNETARGRSQKGCWFRGQRGPVGLPAPPYLTTLWLSRPTCLKWMRATWRLQLGMKPTVCKPIVCLLNVNLIGLSEKIHNVLSLVNINQRSKCLEHNFEYEKLRIYIHTCLFPFTTKLLAATWVSAQSKDMRAKVTLGYNWSHENCTICSQIPSLPNQR